MIFLDTAKPDEVKKWAHLISGVTCNPLILSRERPGIDPAEVLNELMGAVSDTQEPNHLSFQVWSDDPDTMAQQAEEIVDAGAIVKLPMSEIGLKIADIFAGDRNDPRAVNFTGIMAASQVIIACEMHAAYASLFWGRAQGSKIDPEAVCRDTQLVRQRFDTKLLVGSIRGEGDIVPAFRAGADVVTVQPKILQELIHHDRTESTIREFLDAWRGARRRIRRVPTSAVSARWDTTNRSSRWQVPLPDLRRGPGSQRPGGLVRARMAHTRGVRIPKSVLLGL
jgi:transaldolase